MSGPPAAKRRRLNDALHKPFKSPLRTPLKTNPNPSTALPATKPTPLRTSVTALDPPSDEQTNPPPSRTPTSGASPLSSHQRAQLKPHKPAPPTARTPTRPHLLAPTPRQLEAAIRNARRDTDTLRQAMAIVSSTQEAELAGLIAKWRQASRAAAEEVFEAARDRVDRMGGVGAMREREREMVERRRGWDVDDRRAERERRIGEMRARAEEEGVRIGMAEMEEWGLGDEEMDTGGDGEQGEGFEDTGGADGGRDDENFTIGMMLKSMNIDLDLIGYSMEGEMWIV